jgi:hypothetical protein
VSELGLRSTTGSAHDLRALLDEVFRTREDQHTQQSRRGTSAHDLHSARAAALHALEGYAVALQERGWPVPPKMRTDIQLLRSLCSPIGRGLRPGDITRDF